MNEDYKLYVNKGTVENPNWKEVKIKCNNISLDIAKPKLNSVFVWKREGSFLDQIKDVWKCYINNSEHYVARVAVNTLGECRIIINGNTHKSIVGIQNAKPYVESVLNDMQHPN